MMIMISLIIALLYYQKVTSVYAFSTLVVRINNNNNNHRRIIRVTTTTTTTNMDYVPTTQRTIRTPILHVTNIVAGVEDDDDNSNNNNNNHHHQINVNTDQQQQLKKSITKLVIPTITDENSATLLSSLNRPVLVDAFAPWCGPCKLLDKVLRKVQPQYLNIVDFCRWNVNDTQGTHQIRTSFLNAGYELTQLPSLIVYRNGLPMAVRPGFANEYQIQDFLELTLHDVLERTFDEFGVKMITPTPTTTTLTNDVAVVEVAAIQVATLVKDEEEEEEEVTCLEAKEVGREIVIVETECITGAAVAVVEIEEEDQQQHQQQETPQLDDNDNDDDDCKTPQECYNRLEQSIWKDRKVVPAMDGIGLFLPTRMRVVKE